MSSIPRIQDSGATAPLSTGKVREQVLDSVISINYIIQMQPFKYLNTAIEKATTLSGISNTYTQQHITDSVIKEDILDHDTVVKLIQTSIDELKNLKPTGFLKSTKEKRAKIITELKNKVLPALEAFGKVLKLGIPDKIQRPTQTIIPRVISKGVTPARLQDTTNLHIM
jgi:hypothetical protein